jgi:hypothetical protein
MLSRFILEDGRIEYEGEFNFNADDYTGRWLMTSHCNIPRKVVSDKIINNIRVLKLKDKPEQE